MPTEPTAAADVSMHPEFSKPVLGICWDSAHVGGDFLRIDQSIQCVAHFRPFPLPGGDVASHEPRRCALDAMHAITGDLLFNDANEITLAPFTTEEIAELRLVLVDHNGTPSTSSAARLFDAVASITGLRHCAGFDGQAERDLEHAIDPNEGSDYPFFLHGAENIVVDWQPMLEAIHRDVVKQVPIGRIAARFHHTLVDVIAEVARHFGIDDVVLIGSCFQNNWLTTHAVARLQAEGFRPHCPRWVPSPDGSLALDQIVAQARLDVAPAPAHWENVA